MLYCLTQSVLIGNILLIMSYVGASVETEWVSSCHIVGTITLILLPKLDHNNIVTPHATYTSLARMLLQPRVVSEVLKIAKHKLIKTHFTLLHITSTLSIWTSFDLIISPYDVTRNKPSGNTIWMRKCGLTKSSFLPPTKESLYLRIVLKEYN